MEDYFFAASIDNNAYTIDLHGAPNVKEALEFLDSELYECMKEEKYCRIVYGIGTGAMRRGVLEHLEHASYISGFEEDVSHPGSCIVVF